MDISKLKYFQVTAQLEHMTKAANELNVSQPALSKTISQLEMSLGSPLFQRKGRQIRLNQFGEILLERTNAALLEIEEGERQIKELAGLDEGIISIAATLPHTLSILLGGFLKLYPNVRIKQYHAFSTKMKKILENAQVDLCISTYPITGKGIEWIPLIDEEIFLSVPKEHHFSTRKSVLLIEAKNEKFIGSLPGHGFRAISDSFCEQAGFKPNTTIEVENGGTILQLVGMGYGITFSPGLSLLMNHPGVVHIPIESPICRRTIGIAYKKNHYVSKASERFRQYVIDFFSSL